MAARPKRPPKSRGTATPRKAQARSNPPAKKAALKSARLQSQTKRKAAGSRRAGRVDPVAAAELEALALGLAQISDMRAELAELRTMVEAIAQNVAALVEDRLAQELDAERSEPTVSDDVLIVEVDEDAAGGDAPEAP